MLDKLFSEITINGKTLKNRCVVNPLLTNFCEEDGTCTERFAAYHEAKAKGGFGMIVTENVAHNAPWASKLPPSVRYRGDCTAESSGQTGL